MRVFLAYFHGFPVDFSRISVDFDGFSLFSAEFHGFSLVSLIIIGFHVGI